jgi:hypothetical protein
MNRTWAEATRKLLLLGRRRPLIFYFLREIGAHILEQKGVSWLNRFLSQCSCLMFTLTKLQRFAEGRDFSPIVQKKLEHREREREMIDLVTLIGFRLSGGSSRWRCFLCPKKKMKSGNEIKFICFLSFLFADQTLREAGNNWRQTETCPGDLRQLYHERTTLAYARNNDFTPLLFDMCYQVILFVVFLAHLLDFLSPIWTHWIDLKLVAVALVSLFHPFNL